jgi:cell division protein FtsI/penicillin-binding protein 2
MSRRFPLFYLVMGTWMLILALRLGQIQVLQHEHYLARSLHTQRVEEFVRRAEILDRNGRLLAGSETGFSLSVALDTRSAAFTPEDLQEVARCLRLPLDQVKAAAAKRSGYSVVTRKAEYGQIQALRALGHKGLLLPLQHQRVYPYEGLTEHLLGFVDYKEDGQAGLERFYDARLKGRPGAKMILRDSRRASYDLDQVLEAPVPGTPLETTLDIPLQHVGTEALAKLDAVCRPEWASATVMDPRTGAILAHAIWPPLDPGARGQARDERLASHPFEPGSIVKPLLAEAALARGVARPDETIWCGHGAVTLLGRTIKDHAVFDDLTFTETLMFSSNVGCIKWGQRLSGADFMEALHRFGLGRKTGIDLAPESPGSLPPARRANELARAYMSIGQGLSVTHAQVLRAYAALANGGFLVTPHFAADFKEERKAAADPGALRILRNILFQTVEAGSGKKARLDGVAWAGKTGTAQKAVPGRGYVPGSYVSSFVGWFPVDRPQALVLVVVSEPRGVFYGSEVAAPVARDIAHYLNLGGRLGETI